MTPGYVGADLSSLMREAAMHAVNRVLTELQDDKIDMHGVVITQKSTEPGNVALPKDIEVDEASNKVITEEMDTTEKPVPTNEAASFKSQTLGQNKSDPSQNEMVDSNNTQLDKDTDTQIDSPTDNSDNSLGSTGFQFCGLTSAADNSEVKPSSRQHMESVLQWLRDQPPLTEDQLANLSITMNDFGAALKVVQPSAKREGFATVPNVTWEDIGALKNVREELQIAILAPVRYPEQFKALGLSNPPGVLLAGPPGCGKTLLAKAIANESGINFISVKGPELLNMYVGESERAVRQVFQRARNSAPCVIFFDELDALCPKRSQSGEGGASVRVVNQLLTEMDGLEARKQVYIMGATNRPDIVDPAILRPGRLDKLLYVGLPSEEDRTDILRTITKNGTKPCLSEDVIIENIAKDPKCQGFTGADLSALVREASVLALKEHMALSGKGTNVFVSVKHFEAAFLKVRPSVSPKDQEVYARIKQRTGMSF